MKISRTLILGSFLLVVSVDATVSELQFNSTSDVQGDRSSHDSSSWWSRLEGFGNGRKSSEIEETEEETIAAIASKSGTSSRNGQSGQHVARKMGGSGANKDHYQDKGNAHVGGLSGSTRRVSQNNHRRRTHNNNNRNNMNRNGNNNNHNNNQYNKRNNHNGYNKRNKRQLMGLFEAHEDAAT